MNYKLKSENGKTTFQLQTGKDFVESTLPVSEAEEIIKSGKISESNRDGFDICVNRIYHFQAEIQPKKKTVRKKGETKNAEI